MRLPTCFFAGVLAIGAAATSFAQPATPAAVPTHPAVRVTRAEHPIEIDGVLDEPVWAQAEPVTHFLQRDPDQGEPARQKTEAFLLYDDDAIYVGARLFDTAPDSIVARLARRDNDSRSDRFAVGFDPFHDKRTGYYFGINAAGTLYDGTYRNDSWDDDSWDGVWEGRVHRDANGWQVEMRIPFSQLRFRNVEPMVWGFNLLREVPRLQEEDYLVYPPRDDGRYVSLWPELVGLQGLRPSRNIEVVPYTTAKAEYLQRRPGDPFNDGSRYTPNMGADIRTNLGSNLTLNATINPDFGQVEVDPAVVNLSDSETFFNEKRPFFVENSSVFGCGNNGANDYWGFNWQDPLFFYTRRIGRPPQGSLPDHEHADVPVGTKILGAAKITGQPAPGWNFGTVHALTAREQADFEQAGARDRAVVEPSAYYGVVRGMREFKEQRKGLGLMTLTTARKFDDDRLRPELNSGSLVTALDGWVFLDSSKTWVVSGWAAATHVRGSRERMTRLQRSSAHYFQRPDAGGLGVDSAATSLTGHGVRLWLNKQRGASFANFAAGYMAPGFDVNDLGYFGFDNYINVHGGAGYNWSKPTKHFRNKMLMGALASSWDFEGLRNYGIAFGQGRAEFTNRFSLETNAYYNPRSMSGRRTRGGPRMRSLANVGGSFYLDTDGSRKRFYYIQLNGDVDEGESWNWSISPGFTWKPVTSASVSIEPSLERSHTDAFWVRSVDDPTATATYGARYVFADLDQNTLSAGVRFNVAFTPNVSLQFFGQPLVASGRYDRFKELAYPGTRDFNVYGENGSTWYADTSWADPDGPGPAPGFRLRDPDFTIRSLRGNAVARWEYRPGSTIYFVWTQERSGSEPSGEFKVNRSLTDLVHEKPNNIFLVKIAHHFQL